jgi:hypothetical protein
VQLQLETSAGKVVGHFILTDLTEHFIFISKNHKGIWCSKDKVLTIYAEVLGLELVVGLSPDFSACHSPFLVTYSIRTL